MPSRSHGMGHDTGVCNPLVRPGLLNNPEGQQGLLEANYYAVTVD